jgi:hypothetical protein
MAIVHDLRRLPFYALNWWFALRCFFLVSIRIRRIMAPWDQPVPLCVYKRLVSSSRPIQYDVTSGINVGNTTCCFTAVHK